jgi:hypothetical protein
VIIRLRAVVWLPAGVRVLHGGLVLHGETWGRASLGGLGVRRAGGVDDTGNDTGLIEGSNGRGWRVKKITGYMFNSGDVSGGCDSGMEHEEGVL